MAEPDLALAFAEAIARPNGSALLIDERGMGEGWCSIVEAHSTGRAFAVEPADHMVAVDIDDEADQAWAEVVREGLGPRGCCFVLVESGRTGHGHLWVLTPPGWTYEYLKLQMEAVAGNPTSWRQVRRNATRPPYAPHRLGGRSRVVDPEPEAALQLFQSHRCKGIPRLAEDILSWLDPSEVVHKRGELDRGRSIHRAAVSMVNARCSESDFLALLQNRNPVTSKYHEMPSDRRADFAARAWREACTFVREHPPRPSSEVARAALAGLLAAIPNLEWSSRTGSADRAAYAALVHFGTRGGTTEVSASIRQIGMAANLSNNGAMKALKRLEAARMVERLPAPEYGHACKYRLLPLRVAVAETTVTGDNSDLSTGDRRFWLSHRPALLADIFSNGTGLGLSRRETWEALPEEPTKTSELSDLRPGQLRLTTIRSHLRVLGDHGFAGRKGQRWWRLHPDDESLRRTAVALGVKGKTEARAAYNARVVEEYQKQFDITFPRRRGRVPARDSGRAAHARRPDP